MIVSLALPPLPAGTVGMDLAGLYLLARLGRWPDLQARTVHDLLATLRNAPLDATAAELRRLAHSGMPDALVPFRRDELDLVCAALWVNGGNLGAMRTEFEGEDMRVEAGFFRLWSRRVQYIDTLEPVRERAVRLLPVAALNALLQRVERGSRRRARLWVPGEDDEALRLIGPWVAPCLSGMTAPAVKLSLVRPGSGDEATSSTGSPTRSVIGSDNDSPSRVELGEFRATLREGDLVFSKLPPECLMELQAAALSGAWLLIEHRALRFFGSLPDLFEPGSGREGWFHPSNLFEAGLGTSAVAHLGVPMALARQLVTGLPWAWIHDPLQFLSLAAPVRVPADSAASPALSTSPIPAPILTSIPAPIPTPSTTPAQETLA